jgi:hypothetical protein
MSTRTAGLDIPEFVPTRECPPIPSGQLPAGTEAGEQAAPARARAAHGFRLVLSRTPTPGELDRLVAAFDAERDQFRREPERARQATGAVAVVGADAAEQAAWTLVANALLNLDEAITRE